MNVWMHVSMCAHVIRLIKQNLTRHDQTTQHLLRWNIWRVLGLASICSSLPSTKLLSTPSHCTSSTMFSKRFWNAHVHRRLESQTRRWFQIRGYLCAQNDSFFIFFILLHFSDTPLSSPQYVYVSCRRSLCIRWISIRQRSIRWLGQTANRVVAASCKAAAGNFNNDLWFVTRTFDIL